MSSGRRASSASRHARNNSVRIVPVQFKFVGDFVGPLQVVVRVGDENLRAGSQTVEVGLHKAHISSCPRIAFLASASSSSRRW
jgi:hypothetical protein